MQPYAQTHVQLLRQLEQEGYSDDELSCVCAAHRLATDLFASLYRPSGKDFMAHLIGTASILASFHAPARVVAAGLLCGVYENGDFGDGTKGISRSKRNEVRLAVGDDVEEYVAKCGKFPWGRKTVSTVYETLDTLKPADRYAILVRLAKKLEDLSELGALYCLAAENKRRVYSGQGPAMIDIAGKLGFPTLSRALARALEETESSTVSARLHSRHEGMLLLPPKSYCRRTFIMLHQESARIFELIRSKVNLRSRFRNIVHGIRQGSI